MVKGSTKRTVHMAMPTKKNGSVDKRYTTPQFTKSNGTRDLRATPTRSRK